MSNETNTVETNEVSLEDNLDAVRQELSGGVFRANSLEELSKMAPQQQDQSKQENNQGNQDNGDDAAPSDNIGLSDNKAESPSDDASEDREEDGSDTSTSEPADKDEPEDSPFTTVEDDYEEGDEESEEEEYVAPSLDFEELSNQIGYEVTSEEDIAQLVRSLSSKDPYEDLSPMLKQAAEFERNGGDVREYFNVLSVDTEALAPKEALWHKFKTDNSALAQENSEFARQKFEKEFNSKYQILNQDKTVDDFETIEEYNNFLSEKKFAQNELEWESKNAKSELEKNREEAFKSAPAKPQVDEQRQRELYESYQQEASYYKENFEALQLPVDEKGKTFYNIGLNEASKPLFDEWMDNPANFLEHLGINQDNTIDAEKLAQNIALIAAFSVEGENSVGVQFAKAMTERINRNTVETRLENPAPEGGKTATSFQSGGNDMAEAIEALRNDVMNRGRR